MKCFKCGFRCVTRYIMDNHPMFPRVIAVSKVCNMCGWESYPTKLPEKI